MTALQSALLDRRFSRVGKILMSVAIACILVLVGFVVLPVFWAMFFILCSCLTIVFFLYSFGMVVLTEVYRLFVTSWFSVFTGGTDIVGKVINAIPITAPIVGSIGIAASLVSCAMFFILRKNQPSFVRLIVSGVLLVLAIVFTILVSTGNIITIAGG